MTKINEQLIFNLNRQGKIGLENFFISESNNLAVNTIKNWQHWPTKKIMLVGPTGSGKSHLANFWCNQSGAHKLAIGNLHEVDIVDLSNSEALLIDDIDNLKVLNRSKKQLVEEKLFYLLNSTANTSCFLMMTSSAPVSSWGLQLPDLISRLKTSAFVELLPPDDELILAVLLKQFDDKQIKVSPEFILFVSKRINRTFDAIRKFVNAIDHLALKQKREVTIPIASELLDSLNQRNGACDDIESTDPIVERSNISG